MASYHCTVKAGASAGAAAHDAYIEREGKYSSRSDLEVAESGNLPAWASCSADFWKASDLHERANAKGYQEYEVALPRELPPAARLELVRAFVQQELGERHTYSFAIHTPKAALEGGEQPHAHIMFSDRHLDGIERPVEQHFKRYNSKNPEKGGCRKGEGAMTGEERSAQLLGIRERWAKLQNEHLERHGATARVDHRSLKDQGIDRAPEEHLGPRHIEGRTPFFRAVMQARADRTLAATLDKAIAGAQRDLDQVKAESASLIERASRKSKEELFQQAVNEVVHCLEEPLKALPEIVREAAAEKIRLQRELLEQRELEIQARTEIKNLRTPGLLSLPGTRTAYQQERARINKYGIEAIAAQKKIDLDIQDAELRQKNPLDYANEYWKKKDPEHAARMKKIDKDPEVWRKGKELFLSRIINAQKTDVAITKEKLLEKAYSVSMDYFKSEKDIDR